MVEGVRTKAEDDAQGCSYQADRQRRNKKVLDEVVLVSDAYSQCKGNVDQERSPNLAQARGQSG